MFIQLRISKTGKSTIVPAAALATIVGIALLATATPAMSQDTGAALEEIVVTSRRYEETIEDAPVAVGVMTES